MTTLPPETTTEPQTTTLPPEETTLPPETTSTLPVSACGNGVCDASEGSESCPADCSKPASPFDYLIYAVLAAVLLAIFFVIKKKSDEKRIEKQREDYEKWKQEKGGMGM